MSQSSFSASDTVLIWIRCCVHRNWGEPSGMIFGTFFAHWLDLGANWDFIQEYLDYLWWFIIKESYSLLIEKSMKGWMNFGWYLFIEYEIFVTHNIQSIVALQTNFHYVFFFPDDITYTLWPLFISDTWVGQCHNKSEPFPPPSLLRLGGGGLDLHPSLFYGPSKDHLNGEQRE